MLQVIDANRATHLRCSPAAAARPDAAMWVGVAQPLAARVSDQQNQEARLNWLGAAIKYEEYRKRLFRSSSEEQEMLLMRRPVTTQQTFAMFGLLLGLIPPAAIFYRMGLELWPE